MNSATVSRSWISLPHDGDAPDGYLVTTETGDRFVLSHDELVRACRVADKWKEFLAQFKEFIKKLDSWLEIHASKIRDAYLTFGSGKLDLVVIQRAKEFDQNLDKSLVEFDIEIASNSQFDLIRLDVLVLPDGPEESLRSFVFWSGGTLRRQFG